MSRSRAHPWFAEGVSLEQRLVWTTPSLRLCFHGHIVNDGRSRRVRGVWSCSQCDGLIWFGPRLTVEDLFPGETLREDFDLICAQHGIYGRVDRGDRCGSCVQRLAQFVA